jgi:hypothetical protein
MRLRGDEAWGAGWGYFGFGFFGSEGGEFPGRAIAEETRD